MKRKLRAALAALTVATATAHAVYLDPHGQGQVLVFPYYTTNGNNGTLVSIVNTTTRGKALKLRFREGYDGRPVLDLDVYLAPLHTWVAQVAARGADGDVASLLTNDASCTVPALTNLPGGALRYIDFSTAAFAGTNGASGPTGNSDGGPTTPDRTREGHFDVFEMGEVIDSAHGSLRALGGGGAQPDCAQLADAWSPGGYWTADPTADMSAPGGGIYGSAVIIDIEAGTAYSQSAHAIDGFSTTVQHAPPGAAAPDLDTASASAGVVSAFVPVGGRLLQLDYANPIDAISALFMTDRLDAEFDRNDALAALTDWVVTAPTKRFYVDPASVAKTAAAPFDRAFLAAYTSGYQTTGGVITDQWGSAFPYACVLVDTLAYDRDGTRYPVAEVNPGGLPAPVGGSASPSAYASPSLMPCLETSVLTFSTKTVSGLARPLSALGSSLVDAADPGNHSIRPFGGVDALPPAGILQLDLQHDAAGNAVMAHRLTAATNGDVLLGLPLIGFRVTNYVNADVEPGVLANYSIVLPLHPSVTCVNGNAPC